MIFNPLFNKVTIIVVTFQSAHCLDSLSPLLSVCPHVVISDNCSEDGCPDVAQNLWPQAKVLKHEKNMGFGAANNRALKTVITPWAFLLNPDCELTIQALEELMMVTTAMDTPALIAPQIINVDGGFEINYRWPSDKWVSRGRGAEGPTCVGFVSGAAMLIDVEKLKPTNFFDEDFFLYYEDEDFCMKLFHAKLPMVVYPHIKVIHKSRGSVLGKKPLQFEFLRGYHHVQSKLTFYKKYKNTSYANKLKIKLLIQTFLLLPLRLVLFSPKMILRMWGRLNGLIKWTDK